jgi:hypothetical protein
MARTTFVSLVTLHNFNILYCRSDCVYGVYCRVSLGEGKSPFALISPGIELHAYMGGERENTEACR